MKQIQWYHDREFLRRSNMQVKHFCNNLYHLLNLNTTRVLLEIEGTTKYIFSWEINHKIATTNPFVKSQNLKKIEVVTLHEKYQRSL